MAVEPAMMSACGVLCSECPAYHAEAKGMAHRRRTVEAWRRIYGLSEIVEHITCGGCRGTDEELFHSSHHCAARRCCRAKALGTCAECPKLACSDLETAQKVWDEVPKLAAKLSPADFATYAGAYCGHRDRLAAARRAGTS